MLFRFRAQLAAAGAWDGLLAIINERIVVDVNGLAMAVETTAINCHDGKSLLILLDKAVKNKNR